MHWASLTALFAAGHDVTFVSLPWDQPPRDDRVASLRELGADVAIMPRPAPRGHEDARWRARARYARSLLWPGDRALFPSLASEADLAEAIEDVAPDALLADGVGAVTAAHGLPVPKLALIGDPPGFSRRERLRWDPHPSRGSRRDAFLHRLGTRTYALRADRRLLAMLRRYDSVGIFGAHRAEWAKRNGVNAWYVRSPIVDAVGRAWEEQRRRLGPNRKPRILLIGHLRGIATISGLHVSAATRNDRASCRSATPDSPRIAATFVTWVCARRFASSPMASRTRLTSLASARSDIASERTR